MSNEKTKNILLAVLLVAVVTLTIAYAALTAQLTITSQATIGGKDANWNVHFSAASASPCTAKANSTAVVNTQPTVSGQTISGLAVTLKAPGDEVTCDFTIDNEGTINAALTGFAIQDSNTTITYTGTTGDTKTADEGKVSNGLVAYSVTYNNDSTYNSKTPEATDTLPAPTSPATKFSRPIRLTIGIPSNKTAADMPANDVVVTNLKTVFDYQQS